MRSPWVYGTLAAVSLALGIGATAILVASYVDAAPFHFPMEERGPDFAVAPLFWATGLFVAIKRQGHPVGLALLIASFGYNGVSFCQAYAEYAFSRGGPDLAGSGLAATAASNLWIFLVGGIFLLLLLFPSGRFPSRRWQVLAIACLGLAASVLFTYPFLPVDLNEPFEELQSPLAIEGLKAFTWLPFVQVLPLEAAAAGASVNLLLRFRRSRGVERAQFRWLGFAGLAVVLTTLSTATPLSLATYGLQLAAFAGLPISVGIAIMRYRLYDIDRIINRTLVYSLLTAGLGALYFGLVVGLQRALEPLSGGSDLAIVITTLVVAALFLPARTRVQRAVDRRFNRHAYDSQRTIEAFSARLREQIDLDTLRYELLAVVDETMQPASTSLWLRAQS
jgi:hypothetical protein